jgi:hypothetical protein
MTVFDTKNDIKIEEDDLEDAKLSSLDFADNITKKRVFANILGARLAMKMLFEYDIQANNLYSLYTIHNIIEELDLADIYIQDIKIDVRLIFNKDEIFVPKSHFEYDLLPDLYLVLQLQKDFSSVEFLGFFEPKTLNIQNTNKEFYFYEYERLNKPENLKTFLEEFDVKHYFNKNNIDIEKAEELFLSLADKEISQNDKEFLFKQLAKNLSLREKMVEFENFEVVAKEVNNHEDILKDGMLDIIGVQKLFDEAESVDAVGIFNSNFIGESSNVSIELEEGQNDFLESLTAVQSEAESMDVLSFESDMEIKSDLNTGLEEFKVFEDVPELTLAENTVVESFVTTSVEDKSVNNIAEEFSKSDEDVFNLDDFDFSILEENEDNIQTKSVENESLAENSFVQEEIFDKKEIFNADDYNENFSNFVQSDEKNQEKQEAIIEIVEDENLENSDNLISEVDDFLKDIELSDEQKLLIEDTFENIQDIDLSEVLASKNDGVEISENQKQTLEKSQGNNEELQVLFKKEQNVKVPGINIANNKFSSLNNKKMITAAVVAGVVIVSLGAGISLSYNKNISKSVDKKSNSSIPAMVQDTTAVSNESQLISANEGLEQPMENSTLNSQPTLNIDENLQQNIPEQSNQSTSNKDMNKVLSDAFLSEPVNASISKIAWEVPEDFAYNDAFRKYLQIAGKNLKLNLQNDLLLSTEMAYSNKVVVDLKIGKDGSLQSDEIVASSGSKQIDKIVLQTVKETLRYLKMPSSELMGDSFDATLIINF